MAEHPLSKREVMGSNPIGGFFSSSYAALHVLARFTNKLFRCKHTVDSMQKWRSWASIPVPLACWASALPFELHPHCFFVITYPNLRQRGYLKNMECIKFVTVHDKSANCMQQTIKVGFTCCVWFSLGFEITQLSSPTREGNRKSQGQAKGMNKSMSVLLFLWYWPLDHHLHAHVV